MTEAPAKVSRAVYPDVLRILCCFCVIINHTNSWVFLGTTPKDPVWYLALIYFFMSKIAVPVFFMITGYLLLGRADSWEKCFRRAWRMALLLGICAVGYGCFYGIREGQDLVQILNRILLVYQQPPTNALWYLYRYLGLMLMLPFLQKMAAAMTKRDYHMFFLLVGIVSFWPFLTHYFPQLQYSLHIQLPICGGAVAMLLIGQYFAKFPIPRTRRNGLLGLLGYFGTVLGMTALTRIEYKLCGGRDYLFLDNWEMLPIILESAFAFYLAGFVRVQERGAKIICWLGSCTFGMYLVTDLLLETLGPVHQWLIPKLTIFPATIVYQLILFACGLAITAGLRKLPGLRKLL